jgi:peroxiredoxin
MSYKLQVTSYKLQTRSSSLRPFVLSPFRPFALSPFRAFALSPFRAFALFSFLLFSFLPAFAQKTTINGLIENICFEKVEIQSLYKKDGGSFGKANINQDGTFKLVVNIQQTDLFKLVFDDNPDGQVFMLCLSPNQNIDLKLDCENLPSVLAVKGSPSIEFCKNASQMYSATKILVDSLNRELQTDKNIQFYNEFQSQFKPFFDATAEADNYCLEVAKYTDSLQQFVNSKLIKGKVDLKDIDVFIYTGSGIIKEIDAKYKKYVNNVRSASQLYDFKNSRNPKFENFYEAGLNNYFEFLEQRNAKMETAFSGFAAQIEQYLFFKDSVQIHDLADKKKEKDLLTARIIELSQMCSQVKDTERNLMGITKAEDGYGKVALQEAERNVSSIVKKYQTFYDTESKKRNDVMINYLLANKTDLAVLMFIDLFPRDQYLSLHQEIVKALYAKYPTQPIVAERYKVENAPANAGSVGALAPDLAFENPEGKILKLSDLRGKVVLLDFWAAWCRPCRMENPNVVNMYKKYNKKGFEVFSVSLDRDKASWLKAIQDDGLIWPNHVSDLKQWQSQAAKIYGVSAIPSTFLIDKEGKIIAKNLRGAALENALKELFD